MKGSSILYLNEIKDIMAFIKHFHNLEQRIQHIANVIGVKYNYVLC